MTGIMWECIIIYSWGAMYYTAKKLRDFLLAQYPWHP